MDFSQYLEPKKAALLSSFAQMAKGKSSDDMLPLLLAIHNKAKQEEINFTPDEISQMINILKQDMSPEEKKRVDLFLQMMQI